MRFEAFEARAHELWDEIPDQFKAGVDGVVVERGAKPHPTMADIYTLGECATEAYPSEVGGPDTTRSFVFLYYGSFWRLSRLDGSFDWEEELWETLTHELRHHLESLAAEDALEDVDYAADENFKRLEGEPFDPDFYRAGEPVGPRLWRIEREWFLEVDWPGGEPIDFAFEGGRWRAARPAVVGDVCFIELIDGPAPPGGGVLTLVLIRPRGLAETIGGLLRRRPRDIVQVEAAAEPAP